MISKLLDKLGINYDQSHGVLAFLVFLMMFSFVVVVMGGVEHHVVLTAYLLATLITILLQALNEAIQAIDPQLVKKYGSLKNFQINSRKDWRYFMLGLLVSWIVSPLIVIGVSKLF